MYQKIWYDPQFLRQRAWLTEIGNFRLFFALLLPQKPRKSKFWKNKKKIKKPAGDIIILHRSAICNNHMMHGSWDTQCNWQNFLPFWTIFCPFTPVTTRKIKILKKRKYPGDIITLHKSTENHDHTLHFSWNTMHDRCNFYFHFGLVFALLPSPLTTQKI